MKALYVGILTGGTTSRSRFDALESVSGLQWCRIDTDIPFANAHRWSRSFAFRFRIGAVVRSINLQVTEAVRTKEFELIWIDKGVYLWPKTVDLLRTRAKHLIHYTPDTAFFNNRSRFFEATACKYDLLITTKSFERSYYEQLVPQDRILFIPQSFDANAHRPRCAFDRKRREAVFIGLCEPDRETCIEQLLSGGIPVRIGGRGWRRFLWRHRKNSLLSFEGRRVFGEHYAETLSKALVGLGLISKRFPELHTTRTFEIPACGTALVTERNEETLSLFEQDEAVFFTEYAQLANQLAELWNQTETLRRISSAGQQRIQASGFDSNTSMRRVLDRFDLD